MMKIKAAVTLAVAAGLAASGLGTAERFAVRLVEFEAVAAGAAVAREAYLAAPGDEQLERTYIALAEHCEDLATLYLVGVAADRAVFERAGLPLALDVSKCGGFR